MYNEIKLLKNNDQRIDTDLEWIEEFYNFLQGELPEQLSFKRGHQPKMTAKKAFAIIYYLQEHFPLLPDHIEMCSNCNSLFDTHSEGIYWETKAKHFCGSCDHLVPLHADRGRKNIY
jgi:hypothetical protein